MLLLSSCSNAQSIVNNPNPKPQYLSCKGALELLKKDKDGWYCPPDKVTLCNDIVLETITMDKLRGLQDETTRKQFIKCVPDIQPIK